MISNLSQVFRFAKKLQTRVILQRIISHYSIVLISFFLLTSICNFFFNFYSLLFITLLWDFCFIALCAILIGIFVNHCIFNRPDLATLLSDLEKKSRLSHPVVSISIELSHHQPSFFTEEILRTAAAQIAVLSNYCPQLRISKLVFSGLILSFLMFAGSLILPNTATRYWHLPIVESNILNVKILPGTITVPYNSSLTLKLLPLTQSIPFARVAVKPLDRGLIRKYILHPDTLNHFLLNITNVKSSFSYNFLYGNTLFRSDTINVLQPPSLYALQLSVKSPLYTGGEIKYLQEGQGDFSAYAGSEINIRIKSNPLLKAYLIFEKDTFQMNITSDTANCKFNISTPGLYTFKLIDTLNQTNDSLPKYQVNIIPDELPVVQIAAPGYNKELKSEMSEILSIEAVDDFAISSVVLHWFKSSERDTSYSLNISPDKAIVSYAKDFPWDLTSLHLYPGDSLFYWVSARDFWPFFPEHISSSDTFWFRVRGFDEIQKNIVEKETQAEKTIKNIIEKQKELASTINNFIEAASESKMGDWEQKRLLDNIKNNVKSQTDSLKTVLNDIEKSAEQIREQGLLGEDISRKMDEIESTIQDLVKQYGDSLFSQMDKKNITWKDMKDAVDNVKQMLPEMSKLLDNALQYLQMLKDDQEFAALAMKAENLARQQSEMINDPNNQRIREQQSNILDDLHDLQKDLSKNLNNNQNSSLSQTNNRLDSLRSKMISDLQKNQLPEKRSMNVLSSSLLSLSEGLKDMMSDSQVKKIEKARNTILEMARDVINLSEWQKQIVEATESDSKESAIYQQMVNDAFRKLVSRSDSLSILPPKIMQQLRRKMQSSLEFLQNTIQSFDQYDNKSTMKQSSNSLKSLANSLLNIVSTYDQQGQNSGGEAGGLTKGLRKLSEKQAGVNATTAELLRSLINNQDGKQQGQGTGGSESARQAAQQAQKKIAEELDKLEEQYAKTAKENISKRIDELGKEARRLSEMLTNPQSDIVEKQNQFLTRMLQSSLSMHQQDETKDDRKSEASKNIFSGSTVKMNGTMPSGPDAFSLLRRKALQGVFPDNYRSAINAYFDSLGTLYLQENHH